MNKLFEFHSIPQNSAEEGCFVLDGRNISFVRGEESCKFTLLSNTNEIIIKYDEIETFDHFSFPSISVYKPESNSQIEIDKLRPISNDDISIRLSLCFKGEIIQVYRDIIFGGSGVQCEVMLFKIF